MTWLDDGDVRLYHGDALEQLAAMSAESVQCIVTSPPFWALRDYGTGQWDGGDPTHEHDRVGARGGRGGSGSPGKNTTGATPTTLPVAECSCGAVYSDPQIGLEATPDEWCQRLVAVFRECRRVLRDDGVMWLECGDTYANAPASGTAGQWNGSSPLGTRNVPIEGVKPHKRPEGYKPKDLVGAPWMLAFALRNDGWYLRSDTIWARPNPMPESVTDRPTKSHSYVFLLSKSPRYFFDQDAVREPHTPDGRKVTTVVKGENSEQHRNGERWPGTGRNLRSVWSIATEPTPFAHFATFPQALVERCIKAGTSEMGACAACGAPWIRQTLRESSGRVEGNGSSSITTLRNDAAAHEGRIGEVSTTTTGWAASCGCDSAVRPCVVLDPFMGSGTTALVARRLGRNAVGIELNADYLAIAATRLQQLSLLGDAS